MSTKTHKKLCWNCDGYVHVYEMKCPYCGAGLSEYQEEKAKGAQEGSLSSSIENHMHTPSDDSFDPPYQSYGQRYEEQDAEPAQKIEDKGSQEPQEDVENPLACLLLLIPGSVLFLLGLTAVLFSTDGVLTLQFKSKFGFLYLFIGLPLLYFGYRSLFPKVKTSVLEESPYTNPLER